MIIYSLFTVVKYKSRVMRYLLLILFVFVFDIITWTYVLVHYFTSHLSNQMTQSLQSRMQYPMIKVPGKFLQIQHFIIISFVTITFLNSLNHIPW